MPEKNGPSDTVVNLLHPAAETSGSGEYLSNSSPSLAASTPDTDSTPRSTRREFLAQTAIGVAVATSSAPASRPATARAKTALRTYTVPQTDLVVSRLSYGCANLVGWKTEPPSRETLAKAEQLIHTAYEQGITFYDLADIYGLGHAEAAFGEILQRSPGLRDKLVIQSKCGSRLKKIGPLPLDSGAVDTSYEHIIKAVEGSLRRLRTDRMDILLLHTSDALVRPEEVAQAFDELKRSGKVRYFGVSNHTPAQIELLKQSVRQPLVANQVMLGLPHPALIADSLYGRAKVADEGAGMNDSAMMDYCRRNKLQVQAFSALRGDLLRVKADAAPEVRQMAQRLADLAQQKNTNPSAVALAWLLHHPAGIVPILGSIKPEHIIENCAADRVTLSRSEWYELYNLARTLPPQKGWSPENAAGGIFSD